MKQTHNTVSYNVKLNNFEINVILTQDKMIDILTMFGEELDLNTSTLLFGRLSFNNNSTFLF